MPNTYDMTETARRALHIFYVLDTSGSMDFSSGMDGTPIAKLNRAMRETLDVLKQKSESNADALIKISVLEFNSSSRWLNSSGPETMEDFIWEDLTSGGLTAVGTALDELNSKLSRHKFLQSMTGAYLPVIIFMTDGYATDDYRPALERIRQNKWFELGTKIGFAVGEDADADMITEIVGKPEAVITTNDWEQFARLLVMVSVTASMLCSSSQTTANNVDGGTIVSNLIEPGMVPDVDVPIAPVPFEPDPLTWNDVGLLDFD